MCAMPFGAQEPGGRGFDAAGDITSGRALDTYYVNGQRRRLCFVGIAFETDSGSYAFAGYNTSIAGNNQTMAHAAGQAANGGNGKDYFLFAVDPGGLYRVTTDITGAGVITLVKWSEVDL